MNKLLFAYTLIITFCSLVQTGECTAFKWQKLMLRNKEVGEGKGRNRARYVGKAFYLHPEIQDALTGYLHEKEEWANPEKARVYEGDLYVGKLFGTQRLVHGEHCADLSTIKFHDSDISLKICSSASRGALSHSFNNAHRIGKKRYKKVSVRDLNRSLIKGRLGDICKGKDTYSENSLYKVTFPGSAHLITTGYILQKMKNFALKYHLID